MKHARRLLVIGAKSLFGMAVLRGAHSYCLGHGRWEYRIEADNSPEAVKRARFAIRHWKADAILALIQSSRVAKLVRDSGLPTVDVAGALESTAAVVSCDFVEVGRMAARHFLQSGFREFAFCAMTSETFSKQMWQGYTEVVEDAGFSCKVFDDQIHGYYETDWVRNHRRMDRWLKSLKKPTALMCIYDERAQEVTWACQRLGLRVPDDVALVGVGNHEIICGMCATPLSSVDMDLQRIGYETARLIDEMLEGEDKPLRPVLIPPKRVVVRQSSDIVAINDPDIAAVIQFMRDHAAEPITMADVLQAVPISRRAMEQKFVKLVGRTPKAEIMRIRMERAKTLLVETDQRIPDIAEQAGFTGREIFSASFRREVGVAPNEYRRKFRKV